MDNSQIVKRHLLDNLSIIINNKHKPNFLLNLNNNNYNNKL
jgi:hypothetical protein